MALDHPEVERATALADAVVAVNAFCTRLMDGSAQLDDAPPRDPTGTG